MVEKEDSIDQECLTFAEQLRAMPPSYRESFGRVWGRRYIWESLMDWYGRWGTSIKWGTICIAADLVPSGVAMFTVRDVRLVRYALRIARITVEAKLLERSIQASAASFMGAEIYTTVFEWTVGLFPKSPSWTSLSHLFVYGLHAGFLRSMSPPITVFLLERLVIRKLNLTYSVWGTVLDTALLIFVRLITVIGKRALNSFLNSMTQG